MNQQLMLLEKAAQEERLAHLLLFHGESAREQLAAALRLAQILNCLRPAQERPCQICQACHKIKNDNHPDVLRLKPLKTSLGIEQVLVWQQKVYLRRYEGNYKVSVLEQAETMTSAAGNALLKVIEEPPERNIVIMCVQNAEGVLPTIRSRAQAVYFPEPEADIWLEELAKQYPLDALQAFQLSGENHNLTAAILEHGVGALTDWLDAFWQAVNNAKFHELYGLFPVEKSQAALYLQVIAVQMRRGLQAGSGCPEDFLAVGKAMDELRQQVNPRLVLEGLAIGLFKREV